MPSYLSPTRRSDGARVTKSLRPSVARALPTLLSLSALALLGSPSVAVELDSADEQPDRTVDFIADVQPIFTRACYPCHGPETQRSGFRLDVRDAALQGGELYAP